MKNEFKGDAQPFDILYADYDAWYEREPGKSLFAIELNALRKVLSHKSAYSLEIGVGTGRFAGDLSIRFGLDPAIKPLHLSRQRGILGINGEGEHLPFRGNTFDTCLLVVTLCFVRDPIGVLREVFRVLKPGGQVVLGMVLRESPWGGRYIKQASEGHPFYSIASFYSGEEIVHWLKLMGFSAIKIISTLSQPPGKHEYIFEAPKEGYDESSGFTVFSADKPRVA